MATRVSTEKSTKKQPPASIVKPKKKKVHVTGLTSSRKMNKEDDSAPKIDQRLARPKQSESFKSGGWAMKDFRGADYNPRVITDRKLQNLSDSYLQFGDLSGIVFNASKKRRVLISGHQRIKTVSAAGWTHKIETSKVKDKHGTIERGFLVATSPSGEVISIPLRIVAWDDTKCEMAANIAANAHGGDFDKVKLAKVLDKLDTNYSSFNINLMGLDPLTVKTLPSAIAMESGSGSSSAKQNGAEGQFKTFDEESIGSQLKCDCPRCGFKF